MKHKNKTQRKAAQVMIAAGVLLLLLTVLFEKQLRPTVNELAANQASLAAVRLIEECVCSVLEEQEIGYSELVELVRSTDGKIEAVRTDTVMLNRLKALITRRIAEKLQQKERASVAVPIGSLSGVGMLSARGPAVEILLLQSGRITAEVKDKFEAAGINQTKHQLALEIEVGITAVLAGCGIPAEVSTNCILAETVLIGEIPQVYLGANFAE